MKIKVSFNEAKEVLSELARKQGKRLPRHQVEANIEFFNTMLSKIEDGTIPSWFWPDAMTLFKKQGKSCVVDGALMKLFLK